jgi:hypothetical protein
MAQQKSLHIEVELHRRLRMLSAKMGTTMTALIEHIVREAVCRIEQEQLEKSIQRMSRKHGG